MDLPASKKSKGESGGAQPAIETIQAAEAKAAATAATAAANAAAASSSATAASSSSAASSSISSSPAPPSKTSVRMRDDLMDMQLIKQGAEGRVFSCTWLGRPCIMKERFSKSYRHADLDVKISAQRLSSEVRALAKCRRQTALADVCYTPTVFYVDEEQRRIYMERIFGDTVKDKMYSLDLSKAEDEIIAMELAAKIGKGIAGVHAAGIVHGDLTTSNLMLVPTALDAVLGSLVVIDFGLASVSLMNEDRAVDLYVLERAFLSTHPNSEKMFAAVLAAYQAAFKDASKVLTKLNIVRQRGRKRQMVG